MKKKKINFDIKDIKLLNRIKMPFAKMSNSMSNKIIKHEDLSFAKFASSEKNKEEDKASSSTQFPEGFDLKDEMKEHPDHLFVRALAIVADEPNENGDYFSKEELKKAFHTFVGCPLFVNHKNDDVEEARGLIVYAKWDEGENGIIIIGRVDAKAYPKLARGISEGYISGVSMGCQIEYSRCSICNNKAIKEDDYCDHIKEHKTRKVNGKVVYEINFGIKFIELSFVVDPACKTCYIKEIFDVEDLKQKVADMRNGLKKIAAKYAGKEEIDKLNQAENLMTEVAKVMLDQKEKLELEYVNDLVESLSKLQETKDELIEMGYEQLPTSSPTEETSSGLPPAENVAEEKGQFPEEKNTNYENVTQAPAGEVGTVTMPSAFASSMKNQMIKKASLRRSLRDKLIKKWK